MQGGSSKSSEGLGVEVGQFWLGSMVHVEGELLPSEVLIKKRVIGFVWFELLGGVRKHME